MQQTTKPDTVKVSKAKKKKVAAQKTVKPDTVKVSKAKKKKVAAQKTVKPKVQLMLYEIEATIPTGPYANIKPRITVTADSLADAQEYVVPHINMLFAEFLNRSERLVVSQVSQSVVEVKAVPLPHEPAVTITATESTAFAKAKQAINACMSVEALKLIRERVEKSDKLNEKEKFDLVEMIIGSPLN